MKIYHILITVIILVALVFQLHNAKLFNPQFGLDYTGHLEYLNYLKENQRLPLPHEGWELYQTPLYYLSVSPSYSIGGVKLVQIQNVFYFIIYLFIVQYLVGKIYVTKQSRVISILILAALPVANYLVPMISNESLNIYFIGTALLLMMANPYRWGLIILIILAFYNKYTALTLGPAYLVSLLIDKHRSYKHIFIYGTIFALLTLPIFYRNIRMYGRPLPLAYQFYPYQSAPQKRDMAFFTDLSWVSKFQLFKTQNYSLLGGTWNTFWHDGYQLTVPVTEFHKKAAGLWILGFPLTFLSILGWIKIRLNRPKMFAVSMTYLVTAIAAYVGYNFTLPYPSEVKAFFMSGLPIIYMLGIVSSYHEIPKSRKIIITLLLAQFVLMISYFWILPWWHIAK